MYSRFKLSESELKMKIIDYKLLNQHVDGVLPFPSRYLAIVLDNALKYFNKGCSCYKYNIATDTYDYFTPCRSDPLFDIPIESRCALLDRLQKNLLSPFHESDVRHELDAIDIVINLLSEGIIDIQMKKVKDSCRTKMAQDKNNLVIATKEKGMGNWVVKIPIISLFKGAKNYGNYVGYTHKIHESGNQKSFVYTGVTKRGWLTRMKEHYREMKSGGNKLFHRAWREFSEGKELTITSELCVTSANYESIMRWEELSVDFFMKHGMSLNMIAGGLKGIRELYKLGLVADRRISIKEREKAIKEFQRRCGHKNECVPNLIVSDLWKDDDYASRVICSREDTLSRSQVIKIRELSAMKKELNSILVAVNASSIRQVKDVISGKYYSRVV